MILSIHQRNIESAIFLIIFFRISDEPFYVEEGWNVNLCFTTGSIDIWIFIHLCMQDAKVRYGFVVNMNIETLHIPQKANSLLTNNVST